MSGLRNGNTANLLIWKAAIEKIDSVVVRLLAWSKHFVLGHPYRSVVLKIVATYQSTLSRWWFYLRKRGRTVPNLFARRTKTVHFKFITNMLQYFMRIFTALQLCVLTLPLKWKVDSSENVMMTKKCSSSSTQFNISTQKSLRAIFSVPLTTCKIDLSVRFQMQTFVHHKPNCCLWELQLTRCTPGRFCRAVA